MNTKAEGRDTTGELSNGEFESSLGGSVHQGLLKKLEKDGEENESSQAPLKSCTTRGGWARRRVSIYVYIYI